MPLSRFLFKCVCPNCKSNIPRLFIKKELFPENGVWYKPKKIAVKCPSCSEYLESKLPDFRWCLFLFIPLSISVKNNSDLHNIYQNRRKTSRL